MFLASISLKSKWPELTANTTNIVSPLTYIDSVTIGQQLYDDGISVAYSAFVSMADALRGLQAGFYSWTIVKMYYCVFYAQRALLAFRQVAIFYEGRSGFWIEVIPGGRPHPGNTSSSHKLVLTLFEKQVSSSPILSQNIGFERPLNWIQITRERVNYKEARFVEPEIPLVFDKFERIGGIRRAVSAYLEDDSLAFDPDHAILAFPILVLKQLRSNCGNSSLFGQEEKAALHKMMADEKGPITLFRDLL